MELWDIYDADKKPTGRTMKRNDWCLKNGEYHLTVLGVVARPDGKFLITKRVMTKAWVGGIRRCCAGGRSVLRCCIKRSQRRNRTGCKPGRRRLSFHLQERESGGRR